MGIDKEYIVLETIYKKNNINKKDIFPYEWYNVKEYELKKKILKECIDNNILIMNSSFYYDFKLIALNS